MNFLRERYMAKLNELRANEIVHESGRIETELESLDHIAKTIGIFDLTNPKVEEMEMYMELIEVLQKMSKINESNLDIKNMISLLLKNIITDLHDADNEFYYTEETIKMIQQNPKYLAKFVMDYIYYTYNFEDMTFELCDDLNLSYDRFNSNLKNVLFDQISKTLQAIKVTDKKEFIANGLGMYEPVYN